MSRFPWIASLCLIVLLSACEPAVPQIDAPPPAEPSVEYLKADPGSSLPFSDAVRVGHMLYLSGQVGTDSTGSLVEGGIEAETRQTMENIKAVLERNGSSLDEVVKCTVMIEDIGQWGQVNEVYVIYFLNHFPTRSALGADGLALGALIEIECWATVR